MEIHLVAVEYKIIILEILHIALKVGLHELI